jgi:hypothetical protein
MFPDLDDVASDREATQIARTRGNPAMISFDTHGRDWNCSDYSAAAAGDSGPWPEHRM